MNPQPSAVGSILAKSCTCILAGQVLDWSDVERETDGARRGDPGRAAVSDSHHLPLCSFHFRGCLHPSSLVFVSNNKCRTCCFGVFFTAFASLKHSCFQTWARARATLLLASGPWWSDRRTAGFHPGCPGLVPGQGAKMCLQDGSLLSLGDPLVQSLLFRSPQTAGCRLLTFTLSTTSLGFPFPHHWQKRFLLYPILYTSEGGLTAASLLQAHCQPLRCSPGS